MTALPPLSIEEDELLRQHLGSGPLYVVVKEERRRYLGSPDSTPLFRKPLSRMLGESQPADEVEAIPAFLVRCSFFWDPSLRGMDFWFEVANRLGDGLTIAEVEVRCDLRSYAREIVGERGETLAPSVLNPHGREIGRRVRTMKGGPP